MDLEFHIIYTPGTVKYLRLFLLSLLKENACSFKLVSNGCSAQEIGWLKRICRDNERLEFVSFPSEKITDHATVLAYFQKKETSPYFCFMDSDILAVGEFMNLLVPRLREHDAVFSGRPIWAHPEDQVLRETDDELGGRHSHTEAGLCLGSTYFAVYDNHLLKDFMRSTGIGFERYHWDQIPPRYQSQLAEIGLRDKRFDTAKVLNILVQRYGGHLTYEELPTLPHVGGISWYISRKAPLISQNKWMKFVRETILGRPPKMREIQLLSPVERRRRITCEYFAELLQSLFEGRDFDGDPQVDDEEIYDSVIWLAGEIARLYEEFEDQLV